MDEAKKDIPYALKFERLVVVVISSSHGRAGVSTNRDLQLNEIYMKRIYNTGHKSKSPAMTDCAGCVASDLCRQSGELSERMLKYASSCPVALVLDEPRKRCLSAIDAVNLQLSRRAERNRICGSEQISMRGGICCRGQ